MRILSQLSHPSSSRARWEFLASRFAEGLLDPAALIGMGAAGLASVVEVEE